MIDWSPDIGHHFTKLDAEIENRKRMDRKPTHPGYRPAVDYQITSVRSDSEILKDLQLAGAMHVKALITQGYQD